MNNIYNLFLSFWSHQNSTSSSSVQQNTTPSIDWLPNDVLKEIFLYSSLQSSSPDLKLVCKGWSSLCNDETLCTKIFKNLLQQTKFQSFVSDQHTIKNFSNYRSMPMQKKCKLLERFIKLTNHCKTVSVKEYEKEKKRQNDELYEFSQYQHIGATKKNFYSTVYFQDKKDESKSFFAIFQRYANGQKSPMYQQYHADKYGDYVTLTTWAELAEKKWEQIL